MLKQVSSPGALPFRSLFRGSSNTELCKNNSVIVTIFHKDAFLFPFPPLRKCHNINVKIIIEKEFFLMSLGSYRNYIKPGFLLLVNEILLKLNQLQVN